MSRPTPDLKRACRRVSLIAVIGSTPSLCRYNTTDVKTNCFTFVRLTTRMAASPLISCIVVNWNRRGLLQACLNSLRRQDYPNLEVIVVDNGSSDGSVELCLNEFGQSVRLIHNSENRGFCAANNQGIAAARGEFIALLNNDAEAAPAFISSLVYVFEGRPDVGMAAAKIVT